METEKEAAPPAVKSEAELQVDAVLAGLQSRKAEIARQIAFIEAHKAFFIESGLTPTICYEYIDFDGLEHEQTIQLVKHFGGKWRKTYRDDTIDYNTAQGDVHLRVWGGKPPAHCKIVEVEEQVPEQIIPAGTRKVRKLVCTETVTAESI